MESYKPQIIEGRYATFLVQFLKCPLCQQPMIVEEPERNSPFPMSYKINYESQAHAAGFRIRSKVVSNDKHICTVCAESGKGGFNCYLCKQYKESAKLEQSFGDPPDYLCTDCYATVPAKEWDEIVDRLYDLHQYDFR